MSVDELDRRRASAERGTVAELRERAEATWSRPIATLEADEALRRWAAALRWVEQEQLDLNVDGQFMAATVEVVNRNERILAGPGRAYIDALRRWYIGSRALAVRKLVDRDARSASLARVLVEVVEYPQHLTATTLATVAPQASESVRASLLGDLADASGYAVEPQRAREDLQRLHEAASPIVDFVNRHLAHITLDPDRLVDGPRYFEVDCALEVIGRITRRYARPILGGIRPSTYHVGVDPAWTEIFTLPWDTHHARP